MDKIVYVQNKTNPLVIQATKLEIKNVHLPIALLETEVQLKSLKDLSLDDVKVLLLKLNLLPNDTDFRKFSLALSAESKGYYTSLVYNVYVTSFSNDRMASNQNFVYVVKFHNPLKTPIYALWNQAGVKLHHSLRSQDLRITCLPRLAFEELSAKVQLEDNTYNFSVIHAAKGQLVFEVFKEFEASGQEKRIKQTPRILEILAQVGKSLGSFHSYHALKNPSLRNDCIRYILGIVSSNSFLTITHSDLHPGNVFVKPQKDLESGVTFIDLESMFMSAISPNVNMIDVVHFIDKTLQIIQVDSDKESIFLEHFKAAYKKGTKETLKLFLYFRLLTKTDFVKALSFQSLPASKMGPSLQDPFEMSIDPASD